LRAVVWLSWPALLAASSLAPPREAGPAPFRDVAQEVGITFRHLASPEKKYIQESMSGGVALLDFDNDGRLDVFLTNSLTVDAARDPSAARNALYRNLGGMRFEDVTDQAGVGEAGWAMGVCAGDVDGDGWEDLFVTGLTRNWLYRNNHDGTFTDIAERAGLRGGRWAMGCGFADYDRDGDLDVFVSGYLELDLEKLPEFGKGGAGMFGTGRGATCQYRGVAVQCGPRGLRGESDWLYQNDGKGRFTDVSERAGVRDPGRHYGLGVAWLDYDDDGWPDLYVANDTHPNYLYRNRRDGTFEDVAVSAGVAVSEDGVGQGSMGIAVGDYDHSGRPSLFVTNFGEEYSALYRNDGDYFVDASFHAGIAASSLPFVMWGAAFLDYDNDGWLDIIGASGHVYPQVDTVPMGAQAGYRQRKLLYHNTGDGTFEEVGKRSGPALAGEGVSRGLAVGDLDDDGRLDVVVNDIDGQAQVLHNEVAGAGHWLMLRLEGRAGNPRAIGAKVTLEAGGLRQTRVVASGSSYLSQNDTRVHFGLGSRTRLDRVEVRWPDGRVTAVSDPKPDRIVDVTEPDPGAGERR